MLAERRRIRWLLHRYCVQVDGVWESPGSVARDYLRVRWPQWDPERWALRWPRRWAPPVPYAPMYARPTTSDEMVYVDVRRLWWTLLERFGWSLTYSPGRYLGYGEPPDDYPWPQHKLARNSLVTGGFPLRLLRVHPRYGERLIHRANRHLNIPMTHWISDVMHLLARWAVDAGAVYVHTDGYVAPSRHVAERLVRIIGDCGLQAEVRAQGWGWVRAIGAYRVGQLESSVLAGEHRGDTIRPLTDRDARLVRWHLQR